jgi:predicted alpha/beta-hydrolase family hydrolase
MARVTPFAVPGVVGFLHRPDHASGHGMVLTHGAGSNCAAPLLVTIADAFASERWTVLRCDLAFRQRRPKGPPAPGSAASDRAGLAAAVAAMEEQVEGGVMLAGHSYGGRQASILAAEQPGLAAGLLLLSYPLHPPNQPARLRTEHFPKITVPVLFVHGAGDPFATIGELQAAVVAIPAPSRIIPVAGAGHDLRRGKFDLEAMIALTDEVSSSARRFGPAGPLPPAAGEG